MFSNKLDILELYRCPVTFSELNETADSLETSDGRVYFKIDGKPVLVDFEKSILDKEVILDSKGKSNVNRSKFAVVHKLKDILIHQSVINRVTSKAKKFVDKVSQKGGKPKILIIGGGTQGIGTQPLFDSNNIDIVSFDIYNSDHVDFIADAHNIPLKSNSFDGVWIQYVLEHVLEPWKVADEIYRILKSNGILYSETPFLQQVHEGQHDFMRFTHSGHRWLFKKFKELDSGTAMGIGLQILWSIDYCSRSFFRNSTVGKLTKVLFFWVRFLDFFVPKSFQFDSASSFFFMGAKSKTSMSPQDIVSYYKGKDA